MKKNLSSLLALTLALGITFGAAGCKKSSSSYDPSDFASAKTEEEIYQSVRYAIEQTAAYTGAFTASIVARTENNAEDPTADPAVVYSATGKASTDNAGRMYSTSTSDENGCTTVNQQKTFTQNGKAYGFESTSETYGGYTDESSVYYELSEAELLSADWGVSEEGSLDYVLSLASAFCPAAQDLATIKTAFTDIYAAQTAAQQAVDPTAAASATISATNTDGVLSISVTSTVTQNRSTMGAEGYPEIATVTAKEGKLSGISAVREMKMTIPATEETPEMEGYGKSTQTVETSYAFDQAGYDGLSVTLPAASEIRDYSPSASITLHAGGAFVCSSRALSDYDTAAEILESMQASFKGCTVDGWYTDEACTQKLNVAAIDKEDLLNIGHLYARSISANADNAVVATQYEEKYELSESYRIVFASDFVELDDEFIANGVYEGSYSFWTYTSTGSAYELYDEYDDYSAVYVNGVETTATSLSLEKGKLYVVKYVTVYKDADLSIFENARSILG